MPLSDLIGKEILVNVRYQNDNALTPMTLLEVEAGGIWVENYPLMQSILQATGQPVGKSLRHFLPFSSIGVIVSASEETALSERAFGV